MDGALDYTVRATVMDEGFGVLGTGSLSARITGISPSGIEDFTYTIEHEGSTSGGLEITGPDSGAVGEKLSLGYTDGYADSVLSVASAQVYWSSDDPSVADVDPNGIVTLKQAGNTVIRCRILGRGH